MDAKKPHVFRARRPLYEGVLSTEFQDTGIRKTFATLENLPRNTLALFDQPATSPAVAPASRP